VTVLDDAQRKLREASERYGVSVQARAFYRTHVTDGADCWCVPTRQCVWCREAAPCIHGTTRPEVVVHKEAN
jgi:hypothetical protein